MRHGRPLPDQAFDILDSFIFGSERRIFWVGTECVRLEVPSGDRPYAISSSHNVLLPDGFGLFVIAFLLAPIGANLFR